MRFRKRISIRRITAVGGTNIIEIRVDLSPHKSPPRPIFCHLHAITGLIARSVIPAGASSLLCVLCSTGVCRLKSPHSVTDAFVSTMRATVLEAVNRHRMWVDGTEFQGGEAVGAFSSSRGSSVPPKALWKVNTL
jgi:hypothetical protein